MPSLHFIYASTSGHTEYVVGEAVAALAAKAPTVNVEVQRAEQTQPDDLLRGDFLVLASGTWNTGGIEGQLNPHMQVLLKDKAKDIDLRGRKVFLIALGDERYLYTARAMEHLRQFVTTHHGHVVVPELKIVNEPYGQENTVKKWVDQLCSHLS